ncbi:MAG: GNAT family N-acetyltransferase [Bacteroidia bacterium]|nr:GNAT family N-acetyltransferase [Bacteroidia bacterium]
MVELLPLTRHTWEQAARLEVAEDQKDYLPSNLFSIAQAYFEESELYGIYGEGQLVGFACVCYFSHIPWITRIMVGAQHQGQHYATQALALLVQKLEKKPGVKEIRTTVARGNAAGEYLFAQAGFLRTGDVDEREFAMVYHPNR